MKNLIILLMIVGLISCSSGTTPQNNSTSEQIKVSALPQQKYSEEAALMLGKLYYLANPYLVITDPMQVTNFVRSNASNLSKNSEVIRCAYELGYLLINQAASQYVNPNQDRERIYNIGQSAGVDPLITERAANEMSDGTTDLLLLGYELIWLSQVIPSAAEGNWDLFNNTGTDSRKLFYQMWPLIQTMAYYEDASIMEIFKQAMSQVQPIVEYQIFILASMIQN